MPCALGALGLQRLTELADRLGAHDLPLATGPDLQRRLAAARKRDHGELANRILAQGTTIQTETLSYRAFQRCFGRSVQIRAPGAFIATLTRKLANGHGQAPIGPGDPVGFGPSPPALAVGRFRRWVSSVLFFALVADDRIERQEQTHEQPRAFPFFSAWLQVVVAGIEPGHGRGADAQDLGQERLRNAQAFGATAFESVARPYWPKARSPVNRPIGSRDSLAIIRPSVIGRCQRRQPRQSRKSRRASVGFVVDQTQMDRTARIARIAPVEQFARGLDQGRRAVFSKCQTNRLEQQTVGQIGDPGRLPHGPFDPIACILSPLG